MSDIQHRDLPTAVADLVARVERLEQQSPVAGGLARNGEGSDSLRSGPSRSAACGVTDGGPAPATGLRTERVTLEVTHCTFGTIGDWIRPAVLQYLNYPEASVRVVPEANDALSIAEPFLREIEDIRAAGAILNGRVAEITAERDAAIRERDEMREGALAHHNISKAALDDKDKAEARVAELEDSLRIARTTAENKNDIIIQRDNEISKLKKSSAEASGAANDTASPNSSEPVAWGVKMLPSGVLKGFLYTSEKAANDAREAVFPDVVVPLYTAPPPSPGWLTGEEREAVKWLSQLDKPEYLDGPRKHARVAQALLARVDRLRCLGNAVVPQVVELIGRAILKHEAAAGVECQK